MPPVFKALATITVWILWISGLVMGFSVFIHGMILGDIYGTEVPPMSIWAGFAVALAFAVGAVYIMRLRQKME